MKWLWIGILMIMGMGLEAVEVRVQFEPPEGWHYADNGILPKSVQVMVVGKGKKEFPPSMNLTTEIYPGTTKDYLKIVKSINQKKGNSWRELGTMDTKAGPASLSQVVQKTPWGNIQLMHVILVKDGTAYLLTASSLQEEFASHSPQFHQAFKSLQFSE